MRLTHKYIKNWLQETFIRLEINLEVRDMYHTRLRGHDYEGGAATHIIRAFMPGSNNYCTIFIFSHLWELQKWIDQGWELCWEPKTERYGWSIEDSCISVRKKQTPPP